ncbi:MAG: TolC family protein [Deltaproteobacteria bacterium]|nr:TolC family protein [Deltaproteobacteria bacterium]
MKRKIISIILMAVFSLPGLGLNTSEADEPLSLKDVITIGLKNNPNISASRKSIEAEEASAGGARAERLPVINLNGGATRYRYAQPITPITGSPLTSGFPEFDESIFDVSLSFTLPLYRGGRIERGIRIAEIKKSIAEDTLKFNEQELVYNITSAFFKIAELDRLLNANNALVSNVEAHRKNIELFVKAGAAPRLDLYKADVELAHARQNSIEIKNNLASAYELLKYLAGFKDELSLTLNAEVTEEVKGRVEDSIVLALSRRADYQAILKKKRLSGERIRYAEGRRYPQINLNGEYGDRSGADLGFEENWAVGVRFSVPLFDGGVIRSDIARERKEGEAVEYEEIALRNNIIREIKDACLKIESAGMRIEVALASIESAKESLRIERLRFDTGEGKSTDVMDAETALLRAQTDYHRAVFERETAIANLKRATGALAQ